MQGVLTANFDFADVSSLELVERLGPEALLSAISDAVEGIEEDCCSWADDDYAEEVGYGDEVESWQLISIQERDTGLVVRVDAEVTVYLPDQEVTSVASVPVSVEFARDGQGWREKLCEICGEPNSHGRA